MTRALVCLLLLSGCKRPAERPVVRAADGGAREISVWLGESIGRIEGDRWKISRSDGKPLSMHSVDDPVRVTLHLPSGRTWTSWAKLAIFTEEEGRVHEASATILPEPIPLADAVARSEATAAEFGVAPSIIRQVVDPIVGRGPHDRFHLNFPVEGCIIATTSLWPVTTNARPPTLRGWAISVDVGLATPRTWSIFPWFPATCPADAGTP